MFQGPLKALIFNYPKISILFKYSYFTLINNKIFPTKK